MDASGRLSAARNALVQAEAAVGLARQSLPVHEEEFQAGGGRWEIPTCLSGVFPSGLRYGMTIGIHGSRLASMLTAGIASDQGAWVACLGMPDMSWGLASILGMNLQHTVWVPQCSSSFLPQAISVAIDGFDVVLVGQGLLEQGDRRVLSRRALSRETLLLGEGWDTRVGTRGTLVDLEGLDQGEGHISSLALRLAGMSSSEVSGESALIEITDTGWKGTKETVSGKTHRHLEVVSL